MLSIANTDYIRAVIELFGAIINIILAVMFIIITGTKKRSEKNLLVLLFVSSVVFIFDAGCYIYNGNTAPHGIVLNWLCNFALFLSYPILMAFANGYTAHLIMENKDKPKKLIMLICFVASAFSIFIPISNLFYKWMYYIDEENIYSRMNGWYIYTALLFLNIAFLIILVLMHRNSISFQKRVAIYLFLLFPLIGVALQVFSLDIPFVQLGTGIGTVVLLSGYLRDWIKEEKERTEISEERKQFWLIEGVLLITILCISASIVSSIVVVNKVSDEEAKQNSTALALMISETTDRVFGEAINASRTMAQTPCIINALTSEDAQDPEQEAEMFVYISDIMEEFDYDRVFAFSDKTTAFYNNDGTIDILGEKQKTTEKWYERFKRENVHYELDIDTNIENMMESIIFVDTEIRDEDNNYIGICGVGISVEKLVNIWTKYESEYDMEITLVDSDGFIRVASDMDKYKEEYSNFDCLDKVNSQNFYYMRNAESAQLVKYMENLGWYLVIDDYNPDKIDIIKIILPSVIIFIIGILFMVGVALLFEIHDKNRTRELKTTIRLSETDGLTGLLNRYAFDKHISQIEQEGMSDDFVIMMIDINGLKSANDNIGHEAGDELIIATANTIRSAFSDIGKIFRVGGDEFIVTCNCKDENVIAKINELNQKASCWSGKLVKELAVSIGFASHSSNPTCSIPELKKLADELMYQDKADYYARTGKDRRK